jgi:hypothetical protein
MNFGRNATRGGDRKSSFVLIGIQMDGGSVLAKALKDQGVTYMFGKDPG